MPGRNMIGTAGCALALAASSGADGQRRLIGVTFPEEGKTSNLYEIDPATGDATLIGNTGAPPMIGLAFDGRSGVLYGLDDRADLWTLDPETGAASLIGSGGGSLGEGGIAFNGAGVLLASNDQALGTVDLVTGDSFLIGNHGPDGEDLSGLALRPDGVLLGYAKRGFEEDQIVTLNQVTGEATRLFGLGIDTPGDTGGLIWNDATARLLLTSGSTLYDIDPVAEKAIPIGTHGPRTMSGLVFIPAPGAAGALLAGGVAVAVRRRR